MNKQQILEYYSNDFVVKKLVENSKSREIAGAFWDGTFDSRPNILQYNSDVVQMAKKGVTSFHFSVEHWKNPMALVTGAQNYEGLRSGWDVVIDIDSKLGLDESKIAAAMICRLLEKYGVKNYGIKFSGRRGFHISLSWKMFPKTIDYKQAEKLYPLIPRIISRFVRKKIRQKLMQELISRKGAKQLIEMLGETPEKLSPYFFVEVEKDWGNRHMFRAPYSLNEKTWLVSVPLSFAQMKNFDAKLAEPKYVVSNPRNYEEFFKGDENEASDLLTDALDWYTTIKKEEPKKEKRTVVWDKKIGEEYFPPCVRNILSGLSDGRKRSIFTLVNFLRMMNWEWHEIEEKIFEWNERNKPPLPRSIVLAQMRSSQRKTAMIPPSNCPPEGDLYYGDTVNVCRPDAVCKQGTNRIMIKNPIVYPFKTMKIQRRQKPKWRGYSCGVCNKEFKNTRSLNQHKARTHGDVLEI